MLGFLTVLGTAPASAIGVRKLRLHSVTRERTGNLIKLVRKFLLEERGLRTLSVLRLEWCVAPRPIVPSTSASGEKSVVELSEIPALAAVALDSNLMTLDEALAWRNNLDPRRVDCEI